MLRVHGANKPYHHKFIGIGGRLDTIQAAVLLAKLPYYDQELEERQKVAQLYSDELSDSLQTPIIKSNRSSVWAQYTVRVNNRSDVRAKLNDIGIPTAIYYPMPLHLQECFKNLNYKQGDFPIAEKASKEVLSLPMNAFMQNDVEYIIEKILGSIA